MTTLEVGSVLYLVKISQESKGEGQIRVDGNPVSTRLNTVVFNRDGSDFEIHLPYYDIKKQTKGNEFYKNFQ